MPDLDGIPDDETTIVIEVPEGGVEHPAGSAAPKKEKGKLAHELKKKVAFIKISHFAKKLIKQVNQNIISHCGESDPKIIGFKSLAQYLEKKELNELVKMKTLNTGGGDKACRVNAFSCVFHADTLGTLSKLIHDPYFIDYLVDQKHWKKTNASDISTYLNLIEGSLKQKP